MKKTGKLITLLLALVMVFALAACEADDAPASTDSGEATTETSETTTEESTTEGEDTTEGEAKKVAVLLYDGTDTYMGTVRNAMQEVAADNNIEYEFHDGKNDVATQTDQLNNVIAQEVDGILVNIVDVNAAPTFLQTLEDSGIPYLFINRDMTASFEGTDSTIFVGTNAPDAGVMQGEMFIEYMEGNENWDRNGDGKVQYGILHGGLDNPEAQARTEYAVKTVEESGVEVEELGNQVANWDTAQAKTAVDAWMQRFPDDLDVIFSNNDTMAQGAIESLQQVGFNGDDEANYIPVYGVDAIDAALQLVESGGMAGTVKQDNVGMANAVTALIRNRMDGRDWLDGTDYEIFEDDLKNSVRIPYEKVK